MITHFVGGGLLPELAAYNTITQTFQNAIYERGLNMSVFWSCVYMPNDNALL